MRAAAASPSSSDGTYGSGPHDTKSSIPSQRTSHMSATITQPCHIPHLPAAATLTSSLLPFVQQPGTPVWFIGAGGGAYLPLPPSLRLTNARAPPAPCAIATGPVAAGA
jgi:hypothetical protein